MISKCEVLNGYPRLKSSACTLLSNVSPYRHCIVNYDDDDGGEDEHHHVAAKVMNDLR